MKTIFEFSPEELRAFKDQAQKESFLQLLQLTRRVLETSIDLLGFSAPDRM